MSQVSFEESGMQFGPFPEGRCFRIERSETFRRLGDGVRMAEFLLIRNSRNGSAVVWVVEAKSSTPRPETRPGFDDFIAEIREKLTNALSLGLAACLNRQPAAETELPESFRKLDLSHASFRLVLVVNGHPDAWLPPLKDSLAKALHPTVKTWALAPPAVVVLNDGMARGYGLING